MSHEDTNPGLHGLDPDELLRGAAEQGEDEFFFDEEGEDSVVDTIRQALVDGLPEFGDLELLGRGGMGVVFRAHHLRLDRPVAIKVLLPTRSSAKEMQARFEREARALAQLQHPHIVGVHDFGEVEGYPYLVMEFVDGASLRDILASARFQPEEALALVPDICEALAYAHDKGVVHRDIKPENILVDRDGRVKIADFGIAKIAAGPEPRRRLTKSRMVMGTPHYMAPEQAERPQEVDHRADIYSLGVVFYEMLTGELPVGVFPPPSKKVQVDVRMDEVVLRSLEKEPERRYQTVREVKREITRAGEAPPRPAAPRPKASGTARRNRSSSKTTRNIVLLVLVLLLVPILLLVATALFLFRGGVDGPMPFDDNGGRISMEGMPVVDLSTSERATQALWQAAKTGDLNSAQVHIATGANVNAVDPESGRTALGIAAAAGQGHVVAVLIDNEATDMWRKDGRDYTVLGNLVEMGNADLVERAIKKRSASPNGLAAPGLWPCEMAWQARNKDVFRRLANYGGTFSRGYQTADNLFAVATDLGEQAAAAIVRNFDEPFRSDQARLVKARRISAVDMAFARSYAALGYALLEKGHESGRFASKGYTPLHAAARYGKAYLLSPLLDRGGAVNARDANGETPLMAAIRAEGPGGREAVEYLIKKGPDILEARSKRGETAMDIAVALGDIDAIVQLRQAGAQASPSEAFGELYRRYLAVQETVGKEAPGGRWRVMAKEIAAERNRLARVGWPKRFAFELDGWSYEIHQPKVWVEGMLCWAIAREGAPEDMRDALALPLRGSTKEKLAVRAKGQRHQSGYVYEELGLVEETVADENHIDILSYRLAFSRREGNQGDGSWREAWWL